MGTSSRTAGRSAFALIWRTPHPAGSPVGRPWSRSAVIAASASVAHQLDPNARSAGPKNDAALAAYIAGLSVTDATAAVEWFSRSIAADPDFGAAYLALIEDIQARGDRAAAERFLTQARTRGEAIAAVDRARLNVAAAQLSGNSAALSQSLAALSNLTPADANLLRTLAGAELQGRRYGAAIDTIRRRWQRIPTTQRCSTFWDTRKPMPEIWTPP
jgi:thioredoxin-like negative regulator of GroEL